MPHAELVKEILTPLLDELDEQARNIIELRFGLTTYPRTLEEIGDVYGLARERIRQLLRKGVEHLCVSAGPELLNALRQEAAEIQEDLTKEDGDVPSRFDSPWRDLAITTCEMTTEDWTTLCGGTEV